MHDFLMTEHREPKPVDHKKKKNEKGGITST